jgi:anaerobic magnesium-protoporphyrin IX monomethyl ester cyclase
VHDLDLVLINPGGRRRLYQGLANSLTAVEPPIWAGMLAAYVQRQGFSCAIIDANAEELEPDVVASRVDAMRPRLAAIVAYGQNPSASTQVMPAVGAACTAVKTRLPDLPVLVLGGHAAAIPERTLREEDADFVAAGEGMLTLVDLLRAFGESAHPRLGAVRDLIYLEEDAIQRGPAAPLLQTLDTDMPGVAWELLPMQRYRAHNWHCFGGQKRQPYAALYTTLGCPYRCTFCCIHAPFKSGEKALGMPEHVNSYRRWSPAAVIQQLDVLVGQYGVRNLKLADEMFVLNRRHVLGICDLIRERGYDLNIWAYARVDTIQDDAMLARLQEAGVRWLAFGLEAGSDRVRDAAAKGFQSDTLFSGLDRARRAGIYVAANYIFGLPEDDHASMQATLDLALKLNTEYANFNVAMAYPGSALYDHALANAWPLPKSWAGYAQHAEDTLPLRTLHLSGGEVLRFRDQAFQTYFGNPAYLKMMTDTFGGQAVAEIRAMTAVPLSRRWSAAPMESSFAQAGEATQSDPKLATVLCRGPR